mgnify:CR=1 FL=1
MPTVEQWTINRLLETVVPYLKEKGSSSPRLDAELLLAAALGVERIDLYLQFDRPLTPGELASYRALVARRAAREPVAYILGRAYFRHLCLEVGPGVLIPRPETEELVEVALEVLRRRPPLGRPAAADVGTGSGAIALSLAQEAGIRVLATDRSPEALAVAVRNAERLGLSHLVDFRQLDLLGLAPPVEPGDAGICAPKAGGIPPGSLHLVVSNPPYVAQPDLATLAPDVRDFEPLAALDGGPDGLEVFRRLVPEAARALAPGGTLLLEVGAGQAAAVVELASQAGFALTAVHKDLSRKERIVEATMPGAHSITPDSLDGVSLEALRAALAAGAIIGVPTDTVYGLAARWDSSAGVRRLFLAKGRPPEQPIAVLFPSVAAIREAIPDLQPKAISVLEALLPGPYTFIVATRVERPPHVGTEDSLGVRVPDHLSLLGFLSGLGVPLAATSANLSGRPPAATLSEVDPVLLAHCSVAIAELPGAAVSPVGIASTVVDLRPLSRGEPPVILREGAVTASEVLARIQGVS